MGRLLVILLLCCLVEVESVLAFPVNLFPTSDGDQEHQWVRLGEDNLLLTRAITQMPLPRKETKDSQEGAAARGYHRPNRGIDIVNKPFAPWDKQWELPQDQLMDETQQPEGADKDPEEMNMRPTFSQEKVEVSETVPDYPTTLNSKENSLVQFLPLYDLHRLMANEKLRNNLNDASKGPLALYRIALNQTEPAMAAGTDTALAQASRHYQNMLGSLEQMHRGAPGNELERSVALRAFYGCVAGKVALAEEEGNEGLTTDYIADCLGDLGGPDSGQEPYHLRHGPDYPGKAGEPQTDLQDDVNDNGVGPRNLPLSAALYDTIIKQATEADEKQGIMSEVYEPYSLRRRYLNEKREFIRWFGDIELTVSGGLGVRQIGKRVITTGMSPQAVQHDLRSDRYEMLMGLLYWACQAENAGMTINPRDHTGPITLGSGYTLDENFWEQLLQPEQREDLLLPSSVLPKRESESYYMDLSSSAVKDFWLQNTRFENYNRIIRNLSVPGIPLQAPQLDALLRIYLSTARTTSKEMTYNCQGLNPLFDISSGTKYELRTAKLDAVNARNMSNVVHFAVQYADFVAISQLLLGFQQALQQVQALQNVESQYKEEAYRLILAKANVSDPNGIYNAYATNLQRHQLMIREIIEHASVLDNSQRNSLVTTIGARTASAD